MKILIAPSLLSADFGRFNEEIKSVESDADMMHVDVMDGHFVPNITFGPPVISKLSSKRPMDLHLMIENPQHYLEQFAEAITKAHGRRDDCYITVHQEACTSRLRPDAVLSKNGSTLRRDAVLSKNGHLHRVIQQIKSLGCRAAVGLNPATPLETIEPILDDLDMVLLMTVNPGFGGQEFIKEVIPKIKKLRKIAPKLNIQVDGGINDKTAQLVIAAGANILVAGSYVFSAKNRAAAIKSLRP